VAAGHWRPALHGGAGTDFLSAFDDQLITGLQARGDPPLITYRAIEGQLRCSTLPSTTSSAVVTPLALRVTAFCIKWP
jgi:hypothetical protein